MSPETDNREITILSRDTNRLKSLRLGLFIYMRTITEMNQDRLVLVKEELKTFVHKAIEENPDASYEQINIAFLLLKIATLQNEVDTLFRSSARKTF